MRVFLREREGSFIWVPRCLALTFCPLLNVHDDDDDDDVDVDDDDDDGDDDDDDDDVHTSARQFSAAVSGAWANFGTCLNSLEKKRKANRILGLKKPHRRPSEQPGQHHITDKPASRCKLYKSR